VKASRLPTTVRYRKATPEGMEIAPGSNRPNSPFRTASTMRTRPPVSIWALVETSGCRGRIARWEAKSDPRDQAIGEIRMAPRPAGSRAPLAPSAVGPTRIATPTNPTTMPTPASRGRRSPSRIRPKTATQTGIIAMSSAAMPEGMVCSPQATMPIPPPSRSAPTMAESRHSRRVGGWNVAAPDAPRSTDQAMRTLPARPNRAAAIRKGGIVSTAIEMPR